MYIALSFIIHEKHGPYDFIKTTQNVLIDIFAV